jgi:general secretion pathway protein C
VEVIPGVTLKQIKPRYVLFVEGPLVRRIDLPSDLFVGKRNADQTMPQQMPQQQPQQTPEQTQQQPQPSRRPQRPDVEVTSGCTHFSATIHIWVVYDML